MTHRFVAPLVEAREDIGLTRFGLAEEMLMTSRSLTRWETGECLPTLPILERWAYSLGFLVGIATADETWAQTGLRRIFASLATIRHQSGLSQGDLATALQVDRTVVSRWETGERLPTLPPLEEWASALGCDVVLISRNDGGA